MFISSIGDDGFPYIKAMLSPRKREGIKIFHFTTITSSMRVAQYRENSKACIYFCDKRFFRGVMLKGCMEVLEDSRSKEMIWQDGDTIYHSKGVTDPNYCVLKFTAQLGDIMQTFAMRILLLNSMQIKHNEKKNDGICLYGCFTLDGILIDMWVYRVRCRNMLQMIKTHVN